MKNYLIEKEEILGFFLKEKEKNWKNLLKYGKVKVNHKIITDYHHKLKENDFVEIDHITKEIPKDLNLIYEDKEFIVVNKLPGLLTVSTEKEREKTLYHQVREYANKKHEKIFILHRLDKDTSGIVLFVKSEKLKEKMQNEWNQLVKTRKYVALIFGSLEKKKGILKNYLKEEKSFVKITNVKDGKLAETHYSVIKEKNGYSFIDIDLKTGRKNQIRVQFSYINHPLLGDEKYGKGKDQRLYLHAYEFSFMHPVTKKIYTFKVDIPKSFEERMK